MEHRFRKLSKMLIKLDKKAKKLDEELKEAKIEIHNLVWDLIESRNKKKMTG